MNDKIYCVQKPKVALIFFSILLLIALSAFLLVLTNVLAGIMLGTFFLVLTLICFMSMLGPRSLCNTLIMTEEEIKLSNIFEKILKKYKWQDLKEIRVAFLKGSAATDNYICLIFTEKKVKTVLLSEVMEEEDIIFLKYTEENLNTIKKYTNLPVNTEEMKEIKTKKTSK